MDSSQGPPVKHGELMPQTRFDAFMRRNKLKDVNEPPTPEGWLGKETFYPLHYAVLENDAELVSMLLIRGADVDVKSSKGRRAEDLARDLWAEEEQRGDGYGVRPGMRHEMPWEGLVGEAMAPGIQYFWVVL
eukprot:Skav232912  [mRNA]  locus=scaffold1477:580259:582272:- [translate_table: standard]